MWSTVKLTNGNTSFQIPQFHHVISGQLEGEVSSSCQVETARQNIWISFARGGTEDGDGIC